jgi:hypothetical protein
MSHADLFMMILRADYQVQNLAYIPGPDFTTPHYN